MNFIFPVAGILTLAGLVPLLWAWCANRHTSLAHALGWAMLAWLGWAALWLVEDAEPAGFVPARFVALCLTGAAGVAVLGARRPYVGAWNFVVLGLLGVLLLPLAESRFIGTDPADPLRIFFLSATLGVGILNYVPTRAFTAALMLGAGCALEVASLYLPAERVGTAERIAAQGLMVLTPWAAWLSWCWSRQERSAFDHTWRGFRDRFGTLWALRAREQFNQAAKNAGSPAVLTWSGLKGEATPELDALLRGVLQRFMD